MTDKVSNQPNHFSVSSYLATPNLEISFKLWAQKVLLAIQSTRRSFLAGVNNYVSFPQSILVNGFVFGDDRGMPESVSHSIKIIGMQHVLSASGFNVGLMLSLTRGLCSRFCHPRLTTIFSLLVILGYVLLIGWPASAIRAALMLAYGLIASQLLFKQINAFFSWLLTGGLMLIVSHDYLTDISFQLSMSAMLGLILIEPKLRSDFKRLKSVVINPSSDFLPSPKNDHFWLTKFVYDSVMTSLAAQAFTWPLLVYHFGEVSLLSVIANLCLLWLTPIITIGGVALVFFSRLDHLFFVFTWVSRLLGVGINALASLFLAIVSYLGQAEWSLIHFPLKMSWTVVCIWWLALIVWVKFGKKDDNH